VRELVQRNDEEAAEEEDGGADADPVGDDERRPVAADDQVDECDETGHADHRHRRERHAREQEPAARQVDPLEDPAQPLDLELARLQRLGEPAASVHRRPSLDALEQPALAEVGEQPRQARCSAGAEPLLRVGDQLRKRVLPVELLEDGGFLVRHAHERAVAPQVLEHPAPRPLPLLEPLERPAGANLGAEAERGRGLVDLARADGGDEQARPRPDDDRAAGLALVTPPLDPKLDVAHVDAGAVAQPGSAADGTAVQERAVRRAGVLDERTPLRDRDARVVSGDGSVVELDRVIGGTADRERAREWDTHAVGKHHVEGDFTAGDGGPAAGTERRAFRHLAPAGSAQHGVAQCPFR